MCVAHIIHFCHLNEEILNCIVRWKTCIYCISIPILAPFLCNRWSSSKRESCAYENDPSRCIWTLYQDENSRFAFRFSTLWLCRIILFTTQFSKRMMPYQIGNAKCIYLSLSNCFLPHFTGNRVWDEINKKRKGVEWRDLQTSSNFQRIVSFQSSIENSQGLDGSAVKYCFLTLVRPTRCAAVFCFWS